MTTFRLGWTPVGLLSVAIVAATGILASGEIIRIVSPSSVANAEGNLSQSPALVTHRIQHLFPASDFAGLPASNRRIVAFNFRSDSTQTLPGALNYGDERIWISTTNLNSLSNVFANNHGPNKTLVHDGAISYPVLATGPAGGPRGVADGVRLQTPFNYDPSQGNLLVERLVYSVNLPGSLATIDRQSTPEVRVLVNNDINSATGSLVNAAAVIQFEFVPEPSTFVLIGPALGYLILWRRKSGSFRGP